MKQTLWEENITTVNKPGPLGKGKKSFQRSEGEKDAR